MEGEALVESILSRRSHAFGTSQRITATEGESPEKNCFSQETDYREQDRFPRNSLPFIVYPRVPLFVLSRLFARLDTHERRNKKPR